MIRSRAWLPSSLSRLPMEGMLYHTDRSVYSLSKIFSRLLAGQVAPHQGFEGD
jgi:hypothetical protein